MTPKHASDKFQLLDEIEHCLLRPGMFIGSTKQHPSTEYLLRDGKFERIEVQHVPGLMKIFDEIITNSVDEHKRSKGRLNSIKVKIDRSTGEVTILDNGGIPVIEHSQHKVMVPELIFSNLRAGSNFDDSEKRHVAGTHGYGSTLTNIFSSRFSIDTCDGRNRFRQVFENNMRNRKKAVVTPDHSKGYTEISFIPDFKQFGMTGWDETHIELIRKRCIDLAACNLGLQIRFEDEKFKFTSFKQYAELYVDQAFFDEDDRWQIAFGHSKDGHQVVSFANSAETKEGGRHVDYIVSQMVEQVREMIRKKHKVEVKPAEIRNHMFVVMSAVIDNPSFSSQTKEKLVTETKDFGTTFEVTQKLAKQVFGSEIIQSILDWIQQKQDAEERAALRKLNANLTGSKVEGLIDAKGRDRKNCSLGIFEGMSALNGVRPVRDANTFGAFPLRGKFINISEMRPAEIIQNQEAVKLMASIGLKLGEEPNDLRYGKIIIYTDADVDGQSIFCLLLNFFARFWPELFDKGLIYRAMTPLVVAKKGDKSLNFYTDAEFREWLGAERKGWELEYKKGLGSLEDPEFDAIINNPVLVRIDKDDFYKQSLEAWFGNDSTPRKERMLRQEETV
jgi:DNA topoisomerase-2